MTRDIVEKISISGEQAGVSIVATSPWWEDRPWRVVVLTPRYATVIGACKSEEDAKALMRKAAKMAWL